MAHPPAAPTTLKAILWRTRLLAIHQAIVANGGNVTHAARELGIDRTYIYSILRRPAR